VPEECDRASDRGIDNCRILVRLRSLVNPALVSWSEKGGPLVSTIWSGLLIYGLILIGFRSILLLLKSIDTPDPGDTIYRAGYDLFLLVIVGTCFYVGLNAFSILHFATTGGSVNIPNPRLSIAFGASVFVFCVLVVWIFPCELTRCLRRGYDALMRTVPRPPGWLRRP